MKSKNRSKQENLLAKIAHAVQSGQYIVSNHAFQRSKDRLIPVPHIEYVLLHGFHEQRKDTFDAIFDTWNYAIRGTTPDRAKARIIVSFTDGGLLVVTVIKLDQ